MNQSATNLTSSSVDANRTPKPAQDDGVSPQLTDALNRFTDRVAAIIATCDWELCPTSFALRLRAGSEPDFIVQDHGTMWTFRARSQAGQVWWAENVEDGPCLGRNYCVEHRHAQDILDGLLRDGFTAVTGREQ